MKDCIFCKIVKGEMEANVVWEDAYVMAFADIKPVADVHVLFIPKKHVSDFFELKDDKVMSSVRCGAQEMVEKKKLMGKGYKLQVNGGGAQIINHLHFHLIGPTGEAVEV